MKTLITILAIFLIQGCTTYGIQKGFDENGKPYTNVKIKSTRDIEEPEVHYERKGDDANFDFSASSVDNNTDSYMALFSGMMGMMMEMMKLQGAPND